jgi:hypothetical protein
MKENNPINIPTKYMKFAHDNFSLLNVSQIVDASNKSVNDCLYICAILLVCSKYRYGMYYSYLLIIVMAQGIAL